MPLYLGEEQISDLIIAFDDSGVSTGTDTSDATLATGAQMLSGVTAYSKGTKYTGIIPTVEGPEPTISVSSGGLITTSVSNPKGYQSSATTKTATQQLTTKGATTITPSSATQTAVDSNIYTTGKVTVSPVPTETKKITANGVYSPSSGKYFSSVEVTIAGDTPTYQSKTVSPSTSVQTITADDGYDALSDVTVTAIKTETKSVTPTTSTQTVTPTSGSYLTQVDVGAISTEVKEITANGTYTPSNGKYFSSVSVNVPEETFSTQTKSVTPTESEQTVSPDVGYDGLSGVTVNAIPSIYVGSGVPTQDTVTITPNTSAQTAVSAGTYVTGDVLVSEIPENYVDTSDATATAADIINGATAYVNGERITGTMPSLVGNSNIVFSTSIEQPISVNGFTGDVYIRSDAVTENMYVPSGNIVTITIPSTRREEVLGNVQASEVLAGKTFISNSNITAQSGYTAMIGTGTMPSKDAATFTPGTTNQTIDAGQYLSGTQTIQGDANLVPENIISGKSIFGVSGSVVIQKYYTGATEPSSSLGNDGDLYFKM